MYFAHLTSARVILPFILMGSCLYPNCTGHEEEHRRRLQLLEQAGDQAAVKREVDLLLIEANRNVSEVIAESRENHQLKNSMDGSTAAWIAEKTFYFIRETARGAIVLEQYPLDYSLSANGDFAVLVIKDQRNCRYVSIDLENESFLKNEIPGPCQNMPAISNDGTTLWHVQHGALIRDSLNVSAATAEILATKRQLTPRYKKLANRFVLRTIEDDSLLMFVGSAGYYRLFFMESPLAKLPDKVRLVSNGISRPSVSLAMERTPLLPDLAVPGSRMNQLFLYKGGAGALKLHGFRPVRKLQLKPVHSARFFRQLYNISGTNEFLVLHGSYLAAWESDKGTLRYLPLKARSIAFTAEGILFEDPVRQLFLRRHPFSAWETELISFLKKTTSH